MEWGFITKALQALGFSNKFLEPVLLCISSTSMAIRSNGCTSEYFKPSRGLQQGDLLSSFLFNLCINQLSTSIQKECERGDWKPFCFNNQEVLLSHMVFANDIVIFGEATLENIQHVLRLVEDFCLASEQTINYTKSQIVYLNSLLADIAQLLYQDKGFPLLANLRVMQLIDDQSRTWDMRALGVIFHPLDINRITRIPIPITPLEDTIIWMLDKKGHFFVQSAYPFAVACKNMQQTRPSPTSSVIPLKFWKFIWSKGFPPKLRLWLWQPIINKLPTKLNL